MNYSVLSLGAGVNSTALLHYLIDKKLRLDEVVFADTGAEKPETYAYLKRWIEPFLQERGILYSVVRNKRTLIERCLQGHSLPDKRYRWSTRDFKIRPIYKHLKSKAPTVTYMGICYDEIERVKSSLIKWNENQFPLVDARITRLGCIRIIESHGWDVPPKSGCYFCPFSTEQQLYELWKNNIKQWNLSVKLEKNCSKYPNFNIHGDITLEQLAQKFIVMEKRMQRDDLEVGKQQLLVLNDECSGYCMT